MASLHHNTTPVPDDNLPFNPSNTVLTLADLGRILSVAPTLSFSESAWSIEPPTSQSPATTSQSPATTSQSLGTYRRAFVHSSYALRKNDSFEEGNARLPPGCVPLQEASYERLEYLGDAVLGCVVAEYLCARYPGENEGFLSRMRTGIVNGASLASLSAQMGFGRHVVLSRQMEDARGSPNVLEDVLEAFIGAVFVCGGYDDARAFVVGVMETYIDWAELVAAKPHVKERLARSVSGGVRYLEVDVRSGVHTVSAVSMLSGQQLALGRGSSRKAAEQAAAANAALERSKKI